MTPTFESTVGTLSCTPGDRKHLNSIAAANAAAAVAQLVRVHQFAVEVPGSQLASKTPYFVENIFLRQCCNFRFNPWAGDGKMK